MRPFDGEEKSLWGLARDSNDDPIYVLADLLYYPFSRPSGDSWRVGSATSSGVAAHPDARTAQTTAVLELVERDAFMRTWLSHRSPPKLRVPPLPSWADALLDALKGKGWDIDFLSIGPRTVPVILAVAHRSGEVVLGCAAGDAKKATLKALTELVPCFGVNDRSNIRPEEVRSPEDHQLLFRNPEFAPEAHFLVEAEEVVDLASLPRPDLSASLSKAVFFSFESYPICDLTVWRALVPGLIPISFGWDREPLGLSEAQAELELGTWNEGQPLLPHPFS